MRNAPSCNPLRSNEDGGIRFAIPPYAAHPEPGYQIIRRTARQANARVFSLGPAFTAAVEQGKDVYRDAIHPNPMGQKITARSLLKPIEQALRRKARVHQ